MSIDPGVTDDECPGRLQTRTISGLHFFGIEYMTYTAQQYPWLELQRHEQT